MEPHVGSIVLDDQNAAGIVAAIDGNDVLVSWCGPAQVYASEVPLRVLT